jgi:hypothetical protein
MDKVSNICLNLSIIKSMYKSIGIISLLLFSLSGHSQNMQSNRLHFDSKQLDEKAIPWPANGKFLVKKLIVSPNIYSWDGDNIGSSFQHNNTTDLGGYLQSKFDLDTLANLYVQEQRLFILYAPLLINKPLLDSCSSRPLQPLFKPSKLQLGNYTYIIPLITQGGTSEGIFVSPGNLFTINRNLDPAKNGGVSNIKVEAEMTHFVDRSDNTKFIPLYNK